MKFLEVWIQEQTISSSFLVLDNSKLVPTCPAFCTSLSGYFEYDHAHDLTWSYFLVSKVKGIDFLTFSLYTNSIYVLLYAKCKHFFQNVDT